MGWPVYTKDRVRPDRLSEMFALNSMYTEAPALPAVADRPWPQVGKGLGAPPHAHPVGKEVSLHNTRRWRADHAHSAPGKELRFTPGAQMFGTTVPGSPRGPAHAHIVTAEERTPRRGRSTGRGKAARMRMYDTPPFSPGTHPRSPGTSPRRGRPPTHTVDIVAPRPIYLAASGGTSPKSMMADAIRDAVRHGVARKDIAAALESSFGKAPQAVYPRGATRPCPPGKPLKPLKGFAVREHKNYVSRPRSGRRPKSGRSAQSSARQASAGSEGRRRPRPPSAPRPQESVATKEQRAAAQRAAAALQQLLQRRASSVALEDYEALRPILEELYAKLGVGDEELEPAAESAELKAPRPPSADPPVARPESAASNFSDMSWYESRRRETTRRRSGGSQTGEIPAWRGGGKARPQSGRVGRQGRSSVEAPAAARRPKTAGSAGAAKRGAGIPRPPSTTRDEDIAPFAQRVVPLDDVLAEYNPRHDRNTPSPGFLESLVPHRGPRCASVTQSAPVGSTPGGGTP